MNLIIKNLLKSRKIFDWIRWNFYRYKWFSIMRFDWSYQ